MKIPKTKHSRLEFFTCIVALSMILSVASCTKTPQVAETSLKKSEAVKHFEPAPKLTPLELWQKLVQENRHASTEQKLVSVNEFFNRFDFVEDRYLWGRDDYWATLAETLNKRGGDCEDFSIAKYFTLCALDIPEEDMRLTYVISLKTKEPHMVLTLSVDSATEPMVLDSVNNYIFPVSRRPDLIPVFSFNSQGYWLAKKQDGWKGERIGSAAKLSLWRSVLQRMDKYERVLSGS